MKQLENSILNEPFDNRVDALRWVEDKLPFGSELVGLKVPSEDSILFCFRSKSGFPVLVMMEKIK